MSSSLNITQVGAADPELKNSPVEQEGDEEREYIKQQMPGEALCYFNNRAFKNGSYVCSSNILLRCDYGVWIQTGSCDPENL
jgi:hypothetical protein